MEGLQKNAPEGTEISYVKGFGVHDSREGFAEALEKAENADFIVAVAGETAFMSGEAASRADLHLSGAQEEFLLKLAGIDVPIEPLYPFGYGLSYTTFQYSELEVLTPEIRLDSELNCRVKVKNTGDCFGEEIVQLYIHDKVAGCVRPVKELKRFMKIALQPGEQKECEFSLPAAELGYYDRSCNYVVEPGTFDLYIGSNSSEGLHMEFKLK